MYERNQAIIEVIEDVCEIKLIKVLSLQKISENSVVCKQTCLNNSLKEGN